MHTTFTLSFNDSQQQFEITGQANHQRMFFAMDYSGKNIVEAVTLPIRRLNHRAIRRLFRAKIRQSLPPLVHGKDYLHLTWSPANEWQWRKAKCDLTYRNGHPYFRIDSKVREYIPVHQPTGYTLTYRAA